MRDNDYRSLFDLTGKVILLTGGGGFLGSEFAKGYAASGADLAILDIDKDSCESVASKITNEYGIRATGFTCDISKSASIVSAIEAIRVKFTKIDVLHNNAANQAAGLANEFASYEDYSLDDWKRVVEIDLQGMFLITQAVGGAMVQDGIKGSMLQTSSIYGAFAPDNRIYKDAKYGTKDMCSPAVYSVVKAGSEGLVRWLSTYWAESGIRVNALVPGGVESKQNDVFKQQYANRVPLGRMATAEEVVGAAIFLASNAASYITGQSIFVDGGLSAW